MSTDSTKKEALKLYKRSIGDDEVMENIPHGLINNVAVLYQKLGDMANAKEFIKALKLSKKRRTIPTVASLMATIALVVAALAMPKRMMTEIYINICKATICMTRTTSP